MKKRKQKKLSTISMILIVLVAIRIIGQIAGIFVSLEDIILASSYTFFTLYYIISLLGVISRKKWGPIMIIIISILDMVSVPFVAEVAAMIGALVFDIVLLVVAIKQYKELK